MNIGRRPKGEAPQGNRKETGKIYRTVVRDEIGERFALAFEEMEMSTSGGNTILTGKVVDQPHLHGILDHEFFSTRPRATLEPS